MNYRYLDLTYLESVAGDSPDVKFKMIEILLQETPQEIQNLGDAISAEDWEQVGRASHRLRSSISFMGSNELSNYNDQIAERAKSESDLEAIPDLFHELELGMSGALSELEEIIQNL